MKSSKLLSRKEINEVISLILSSRSIKDNAADLPLGFEGFFHFKQVKVRRTEGIIVQKSRDDDATKQASV